MIFLYWLLTATATFAVSLVFLFYFSRQWARLDPNCSFSAEDFGFPFFGRNLTGSVDILLSRKLGIWYILFAASALLCALIPSIGRIMFYLSNAVMAFFAFGQLVALTRAKAAYRRIDDLTGSVRHSYRPIVRMFRASLSFIIVLFTIFNLFFDLAIFA